jgi:hypothetical protein
MSKIELTPTHLVVELTTAEKILGLHGNFKIPAALIRGAEIGSKDVWKTFGMRIGTGVPWFLVYGHYWWTRSSKSVPGGWTYALWNNKHPALVINLSKAPSQPYNRLVLSHPDAVALADQINDAIVAC